MVKITAKLIDSGMTEAIFLALRKRHDRGRRELTLLRAAPGMLGQLGLPAFALATILSKILNLGVDALAQQHL